MPSVRRTARSSPRSQLQRMPSHLSWLGMIPGVHCIKNAPLSLQSEALEGGAHLLREAPEQPRRDGLVRGGPGQHGGPKWMRQTLQGSFSAV